MVRIRFHISLTLILLSLACSTPTQQQDSAVFTLINHQNPGLVTDLGVGLWAWPMAMDYDGDADLDLVVMCPDTPYRGLYFFENTSGPNEMMPVFEPAVRIGDGAKNLQISYSDQGPHILGPGVEYENFQEEGLNNPVKLFPAETLEEGFEKIRFRQWKYVDYEGDGDLDLIVGMDDWGEYGWDNAFDSDGNWTNGPLHGHLFLLENQDGNYVNQGKIKAGGVPLDVYGGPSAEMHDFDGDGDLDIICGEFLDRFTWFENIGTRERPIFEKGRFLENEAGLIKMDLEMFIPNAVDWGNDGLVDLIVGDEDGRVALIRNTGVVKDNMPVFDSPKYFQQKADLVKFGALVTPYSVDWDADGDEDLICGNTAGYIGLIENLDGGNLPKWAKPRYLQADGEIIRVMAGENGSIQGPAEKKWGYTTLSVADWDGDGLHDIIINSIWGKIEWYKNTGSKTKPVLQGAQPVLLETKSKKPAWNWWEPSGNELVTQWRTTPYAIDWNQDGLMDLVMLDTEGYLSFYERYKEQGQLKLKPGERIFYGEKTSVFDRKNEVIQEGAGPLRLNEGEAGKSGRRKFCFTDWDQDGDLDLLVNSTNVSLFENVSQTNERVTFRSHGDISNHKLAGHTTSPTTVDWDKDGVPELLVGAEDGHFYYLKD
tara:strand:- start:1723 stop:3681 length:1959 start_codon:yes stop_codon:yes gene_type:complete